MYRPYTSPWTDLRPLQDVESQLRGLTQDFTTAFNTGNYDQAASLFAQDGVFMAPQQEPAYGQKSIEHLLRHMGEAGVDNLRMQTIRVDHSGDMAMELGHFALLVRSTDGSVVTEQGKYVRVWRRVGAWLTIADCWSKTSQMAVDQVA